MRIMRMMRGGDAAAAAAADDGWKILKFMKSQSQGEGLLPTHGIEVGDRLMIVDTAPVWILPAEKVKERISQGRPIRLVFSRELQSLGDYSFSPRDKAPLNFKSSLLEYEGKKSYNSIFLSTTTGKWR